jgi:hypothetical protein
MEPGPPQRDDMRPRKLRAIGATWCAAAGVVLVLVALICLAFATISGTQAVAIAMPGVVLIFAGLIVATLPDPATGRRLGFQAGVWAGSALNRWRTALRGGPAGQLPRSNEPSNNEAELGDYGLAVGDAPWVEAANRVENLIERRPPRPVFKIPQRGDDLRRLHGGVSDRGHGHAPRPHGSQRPQVQVGACPPVACFWLARRDYQVIVGQVEAFGPPRGERVRNAGLEPGGAVLNTRDLPHSPPTLGHIVQRIFGHDHVR